MGTQINVDQEANDALDKPTCAFCISNCSIPYTDFKPFILYVLYTLCIYHGSYELTY